MKAKQNAIQPAICPRCGRTYTAPPALSRADNTTRICPDCGTLEALASLGGGAEEQTRLLDILHRRGA